MVRLVRIELNCPPQASVGVARPIFKIFDIREPGNRQRFPVAQPDCGVERLDRGPEIPGTKQRRPKQRVGAGIERIGGDDLRRILVGLQKPTAFDLRKTEPQTRHLVGLITLQQLLVDGFRPGEVRLPHLLLRLLQQSTTRLTPRLDIDGRNQQRNDDRTAAPQPSENGLHTRQLLFVCLSTAHIRTYPQG